MPIKTESEKPTIRDREVDQKIGRDAMLRQGSSVQTIADYRVEVARIERERLQRLVAAVFDELGKPSPQTNSLVTVRDVVMAALGVAP